MGQEEVAAAVEAVHYPLIHDGLIGGVCAFVAKTDQVQRHGRSKLKFIVVAHPAGELLREFDVTADVVLQTFYSVVADHKPQLYRAETTAELDMPVAVVDDRARFCSLIAQVFGQDAERLNERFAVGDPEAAAVEVGEHPFMRIEIV